MSSFRFCALFIATMFFALSGAVQSIHANDEDTKPNILWITCEDISPHLGCYGDEYAVTPNLDRLAAQGVRYTHAFATIGVCAPARSTIITGMYPPSIGSQHMRSRGKLPAGVNMYPKYLREAGYYCTNNSKTDYNLPMQPDAWDASSGKAHWKNRADGQPFFAIFNITHCHESRIRQPEGAWKKATADFKPDEFHDPAKATLPPYHPDTPAVRKDWSRYADVITVMDKRVGKLLAELESAGLADDTIVFFYSDHGAGMPRSKRWLYDSGIRVPMIIRCPKKFRHLLPMDQGNGKPGTVTDRLVSFVDFAPTLLSIAGIDIPEHMQGKAFLGKQATEPRQYVYGFRERMDERYDFQRAIRDKRFKYIRNFNPHRKYAQYLNYMYQMPTMKVLQKLKNEDKLKGAQKLWMADTKPHEELYDTVADPHEINNLIDDPAYKAHADRLRGDLKAWMIEIKDLGLLPEGDMLTRFGDAPPYDAVRKDPRAYPYRRILDAADRMMDGPKAVSGLRALTDDRDPAIRYWAVTGLMVIGDDDGRSVKLFDKLLGDQSPNVRIAAAEALCKLNKPDKALPVLAAAAKHKNNRVALHAVNVLDQIDAMALPVKDTMTAVKKSNKDNYVQRVLAKALADLQ